MQQEADFLTDRDLAKRYQVNRVTVWVWARKGTIPAPYNLGPGCTRWKRSEIEASDAAKVKPGQVSA